MMDIEDRVSVVVGAEKGDIGVTHSGGSGKELKVYRSKKKEKLKREREVHSDGSESSEDLLVRHRKFTRQEIEVDSKRIVNNGVSEAENGKKRSRLDVFEYDEYDEIDDIVLVKKSKKVRFQEDQDNNNGGVKGGGSSSSSSVLRSKTAELLKEVQCNREAIDKGTEDGKFVAVPVPAKDSGTESSNEMVQSEDDNNVVKMMVKKKTGKSKKNFELKREGTRKGLRSADTTKQESQPSPPPSPEKNQVNSLKSSSTININVHDRMSEKSVVSSSLGSRHKRSTKLKKEIRNKGLKTLKSKLNRSTRHGDKNVGDSRSKEKQRIRDQIRTILLNAGWTIEHMQRNKRDYQDSIYINPKGGRLWSIVKAYNVFIKEWKNEGGESSKSFTPLPDEDISQLTRKTRSKEERMADKAKKRAGEGSKISKKTGEKGSKKEKSMSKPELKQEKALRKPESKKGKALRKPESKMDGKSQKSILASDANLQQGKKKRKQKRGALLVRNSNQKKNSDDGFIPFTGKRSVLSWLIDMGVVPLNGKVQYMNRIGTRAMQEGQITRDGIHCGCCGKILTVSEFELHAGSNLQQPLLNIYVESGVSLFQCLLDAWNKQEESDRTGFHFMEYDPDDPNDDTCGICADGGNLICCDGCPSTFHQKCLGIEMFPPGDWHCPNCICKVCKSVGRRRGQGDDTAVSALLTCGLCEEKCHKLCGLDPDAGPLKRNKSYISFCGIKCSKIFNQLQKLLGAKNELEEGFSWSLIKRTDLESDTSSRVLPQKAECNSKLAVALTVMNECFLPIVDQRTGINLIHNVVYNCGSNFNRVNYGGFYTVILERGDEIISAATIRIHGTRLAEMPFIGTRFNYRRQGMCRRLLSAIESALYSLNVERLVIPAIPELLHTWTEVFDFKPLDESHKQEKRSMNMLVFPGTGLLQKEILMHNLAKPMETDGLAVAAAVNGIGLKSNRQSTPEVNNKCDVSSTVESDPSVFDKGAIDNEHVMDDEIIGDVSGSVNCSDIACDTSDVSNKLGDSCLQKDSTTDKEAPNASASVINDELEMDDAVTDAVTGTLVLTDMVFDTIDVASHLSAASPEEEFAPDKEVVTSDANVIDNADNFASKVGEAISGTLASGDSVFDTCAISNHLCAAAYVEEESSMNQLNIEENGHISRSPVKCKLQSSSEDASDTDVIHAEPSSIDPDLHSLADTNILCSNTMVSEGGTLGSGGCLVPQMTEENISHADDTLTKANETNEFDQDKRNPSPPCSAASQDAQDSVGISVSEFDSGSIHGGHVMTKVAIDSADTTHQ